MRLEGLSGKKLAIDASIWLYHFVKALRDRKSGETLPNAHILGFLRRICKLLYYDIRPVFVFDGSQVPELKLKLLKSRRETRENQDEKSAKTTNKLLKAKLKKLALKNLQDGGYSITQPQQQLVENTSSADKQPEKNEVLPSNVSPDYNSEDLEDGQLEHDFITQGQVRVVKAFEQGKKDRLADEELAIMDIDSEVFLNLPPNMQQDILLELKSRSIRPSWYRMNEVLDQQPSALDFSKLQVKNLMHRRRLFNRLQYIQSEGRSGNGSAIVEKRRIDAEEGREYILVKNEDQASWSMKLVEKTNQEFPNTKQKTFKTKPKRTVKKINQDKLVDYLEFADEDTERDDVDGSTGKQVDRSNQITNDLEINGKIFQNALMELPENASESDESWLQQVIFEFDDAKICSSLSRLYELYHKGKSSELEGKVIRFKIELLEFLISERKINFANHEQHPRSPKHKSPHSISDTSDEEFEVVKIINPAADEKLENVKLTPVTRAHNDKTQIEAVPCVDFGSKQNNEILKHEIKNEPICIDQDDDDDDQDNHDHDHKNEIVKSPFSSQIEQANMEKLSFDSKPNFVAQTEMPSEPSEVPINEESAEEAQQIADEEREYTQFLAAVSKKNIKDVESEVTKEIETLQQQRSKHSRDASSVTQDVVSDVQQLLRLFGIPFITAKGEAEAQCAYLQKLKIVDGIVTDDSDIFLFGGDNVYRNLFNQSKFVELYTLKDLNKLMCLKRDQLIQLAYLLGSDYTDGIDGVGGVLAMEIISEWHGKAIEGLEQFSDWWKSLIEGQSGDMNEFKTKLSRKVQKLVLEDEFPNVKIYNSYKNPEVETSTESFQWGFPRLDAVRR